MQRRWVVAVAAFVAVVVCTNANGQQGKPQQQTRRLASSSQIRRVVTGKDATGKAIAVIDGAAPSVVVSKERGTTSTLLWVTDSTPADISGNADSANRKIGVPPPPNGSIFRVIEFAPEKDLTSDYATRLNIMRQMGLAPEGPSREHPRDAGMHRTRTIDYVLILSGEIDMLMDDSEVHLKAGDVVVQRGTNHAWVNRGSRPCKVAFILIDAKG
jgi:mannose-6-phosphate isomerase-like protein (cupin superfamily)